jgi:hypothetical protein
MEVETSLLQIRPSIGSEVKPQLKIEIMKTCWLAGPVAPLKGDSRWVWRIGEMITNMDKTEAAEQISAPLWHISHMDLLGTYSKSVRWKSSKCWNLGKAVIFVLSVLVFYLRNLTLLAAGGICFYHWSQINIDIEILVFHGGEDSSRGLLCCDALKYCGKIPAFLRTIFGMKRLLYLEDGHN